MLQVYIRSSLIFLCSLFFLNNAYAGVHDSEETFKVSSRHYETLSSKLRDDPEVELLLSRGEKDKPHVILFFSYGCYGCAYFNSTWLSWSKANSDKISHVEIPITWNRPWKQLAKAYYTVKSLAPEKNFSELLFDSVQKNHQNIANPSTLANVLAAKGFDKDMVISTFESFHVEHEVSNAAMVASIFGIKVSPSVVVITPERIYKANLGDTGTASNLAKVMDFLISRDQKEH